LESVFGAAGACGISMEHFVKMQTEHIRSIFKIEETLIDTGKKANVTLFNPGVEYVFDEKDIVSKSKNNSFIGKKLKGKVIGIINGEKLFFK